MTRMLKHKIKSFLGSRGVSVSLAPSRKRLLQAISLLRPRIPEDLELIRVGGKNDGGYLLPDDLEGIIGCLSPGVDYLASFEGDLQRRGVNSHLIDFSVDGPPDDFRPATFTKKFLGASTTGNHITLADWMSDIGMHREAGDLILQIDIEGAEYEVLLETASEIINRFRIIVLEMHHLHALGQPAFLQIFDAVASKLALTHQVVHLHPNNIVELANISGLKVPPILEVTLLRRDRFEESCLIPAPRLPHPLDQPNLPDRAEIRMPRYWL